ncbi:Peptidase C19, ubiquitin carboxyl-terminal hydrolase [Dillenia turbinata]|uniref:Ubiquitin carboxyl-terminal hydrolase n=1 Tax=Dillenia turbinata TaxID=194707 RepID=A0AAN8W657_9MAGN
MTTLRRTESTSFLIGTYKFLGWWKEARDSSSGNLNEATGVLYKALSVSSSDDDWNPEIVLNLRRAEDCNHDKHHEEAGSSSSLECALIPEAFFLSALKWHNESNVAVKGDRGTVGIDRSSERPPNFEAVQKDNILEHYTRAYNIFCVEPEMVHIWDFSGQTALLFANERLKLHHDHPGQSEEEFLLEIQVYEFLDSYKESKLGLKEIAIGKRKDVSLFEDSLMLNGVHGIENSCAGFREAGTLGLIGLQNLGNTCFMNSAIQCLVHTPKLVDYFLGDYKREINYDNPLGMNGELALAFGELLRKLWSPGQEPVAPRIFKLKLAKFAPQFSGFNQHDSQEFLAFLLDGLHEDLNRVKHKPYVEVKDADGRLDEEVADEYWQNHLARNDSIIVDLYQGQYRSTLVCPLCKKVSVTFDPFMYLSLPLPSTTMRFMTVTVISAKGRMLPAPYTVTVPKCGRCSDLVQALSAACGLGDDETLLLVEIYNNRILRFLEDPADSLALIRDNDRLVAYRSSKESDTSTLVVFMHQRLEKYYHHEKSALDWKMYGIPLLAKMHGPIKGCHLRKEFLKLLEPFLMPNDDSLSDSDDVVNTKINDADMNDTLAPVNLDNDGSTAREVGDVQHSGNDFRFYLTADKGSTKGPEIKLNEIVSTAGYPGRLNVLVWWPDKMIDWYDTCLLSSLPEIFNPGLSVRRPQEYVSLYKCLEAFLKEEPLGPDDMYCPGCKKHRQAIKKLDLWRLPEILVVHLKRFSYSRFLKNKLETFIDFPIDNLDFSTYIAHKNDQFSKRYMLYAISNHYGSLGGGHYTAFVKHGRDQWYEFDDSSVHPVREDNIKTSAAYVLFYKRIPDA